MLPLTHDPLPHCLQLYPACKIALELCDSLSWDFECLLAVQVRLACLERRAACHAIDLLLHAAHVHRLPREHPSLSVPRLLPSAQFCQMTQFAPIMMENFSERQIIWGGRRTAAAAMRRRHGCSCLQAC